MKGFAGGGTTNHIASNLIHPVSNNSSNNAPMPNNDQAAFNYFTKSAKNLLPGQNALMNMHNK